MTRLSERSADSVIAVARTPDDLAVVAEMFREYQAWLNEPVCFDDFDRELENLADIYVPPHGELWLARIGGEAAGVVGMKPVGEPTRRDMCELKRLYVRDSFKGCGIGRRLTETCLDWAREAGYTAVCLETFRHLEAAYSLYRSLGFTERQKKNVKAMNSKIFMSCCL